MCNGRCEDKQFRAGGGGGENNKGGGAAGEDAGNGAADTGLIGTLSFFFTAVFFRSGCLNDDDGSTAASCNEMGLDITRGAGDGSDSNTTRDGFGGAGTGLTSFFSFFFAIVFLLFTS